MTMQALVETPQTFKYKGWTCQWDKNAEVYNIYTKEEWEHGAGYRYAEFEAGNVKECKDFIDSY